MGKSKAKGTRAETAVVRYLVDHGVSAERRALTGSNDCGDIKVESSSYPSGLVLEVKAGKQTANPNRAQLKEWLRQTLVEGSNSACDSALVVVRYNRKLVDADVYYVYDERVVHCYLDEFVEEL